MQTSYEHKHYLLLCIVERKDNIILKHFTNDSYSLTKRIFKMNLAIKSSFYTHITFFKDLSLFIVKANLIIEEYIHIRYSQTILHVKIYFLYINNIKKNIYKSAKLKILWKVSYRYL